MFRLMFGGRSGTCKPVKHSPGSKREQYSDITLRTLGSGDLIGAVRLPQGEDLNEWLAANTVDFFTEIRLIWDIVCEVGVGNFEAGRGFPPGFEYRWADSKSKTPITCSGPQYVQYAINWIESEINNENLFPTAPTTPFPKNFMQSIKVIYTRIFRIFGIVYSHHFSKLEQIGAVSHLNTSFKHFLYFIWEYDLVANGELEALNDIVQEIRSRYNMSRNNSVSSSSSSAGPGITRSTSTSHK